MCLDVVYHRIAAEVVLDMAQIETVRRFAVVMRRGPSHPARWFRCGERSAPAWLVLERTLPPLRSLKGRCRNAARVWAPRKARTVTMALDSHVHLFRPGEDGDRRTLLMLHGTGGDEASFAGLGSILAPGAAVLSVRGNVIEHGMNRFFGVSAEGVYDIEDLSFRTQALGLSSRRPSSTMRSIGTA